MLSATSAITGSSILHGPHHVAQNSTNTGFGFSNTAFLKSAGKISLTACPAGHIRSDGQKMPTPTTVSANTGRNFMLNMIIEGAYWRTKLRLQVRLPQLPLPSLMAERQAI